MKAQQSSRPSTVVKHLVARHEESELAPLLTAWDAAHPHLSVPEWRHLLDEIAHPHTMQAFHRLAEAA